MKRMSGKFSVKVSLANRSTSLAQAIVAPDSMKARQKPPMAANRHPTVGLGLTAFSCSADALRPCRTDRAIGFTPPPPAHYVANIKLGQSSQAEAPKASGACKLWLEY